MTSHVNRISRYFEPSPDGLEGLLAQHEANTTTAVGQLQQADARLKGVEQLGIENLKLWGATSLAEFVAHRCEGRGIAFADQDDGGAFVLRSGTHMHTIGMEVASIRDANPVLVQNGYFIVGAEGSDREKLRLVNALRDAGIPQDHIHTHLYYISNPANGESTPAETIYVTIDRQMIEGVIKSAANAITLEQSVTDMLEDGRTRAAGKKSDPVPSAVHDAREREARAHVIKELLGPGLAKTGESRGI
jgi:hypothetical protein